MESFERVYPTVEELNKVSKKQSCPECSSIFNSESNLNLHLAKTHKKPHLLQASSTNKIYHCPVETCTYHKSTYFKKLKFLKQHYLKVHSERSYICSSCNKGFSTQATCNRHAEYCNVLFKCCDCKMFYACYDTLKTHCRRKKHQILEKSAYRTASKTQESTELVGSSKARLILPKPSPRVEMILIKDTSDQSFQTENSKQNSQETQTLLARKMPHFTVETQTSGDYFTKRREPLNSVKNVDTQTANSGSCNTSIGLDGFGHHEVQRNSSSTQTTCKEPEYIFSSTSTHDSIHTDTSDLMTELFDSIFYNCNTETQTDFIFNDELFKYCDDYTNMCTQTCEDLLLGEIELNDTHTQTVFDDILKSVESQTVMSQSQMVSKNNMTHMDTQTDAHFKDMLEEINT